MILFIQNAFDIVQKNIYHAAAVLVKVNAVRVFQNPGNTRASGEFWD